MNSSQSFPLSLFLVVESCQCTVKYIHKLVKKKVNDHSPC